MARRLSLVSFVQNLSGYGRVPHVWGFLCVLLCSCVCPLGSVAVWAFAGDRVHLWLVAKNSRNEAAAPEHQHGIVPSQSGARLTQSFPKLWVVAHESSKVATFPKKRSEFYSLETPWWSLPKKSLVLELLNKGFFSLGALSVLCHCTPNKRVFTF